MSLSIWENYAVINYRQQLLLKSRFLFYIKLLTLLEIIFKRSTMRLCHDTTLGLGALCALVMYGNSRFIM